MTHSPINMLSSSAPASPELRVQGQIEQCWEEHDRAEVDRMIAMTGIQTVTELPIAPRRLDNATHRSPILGSKDTVAPTFEPATPAHLSTSDLAIWALGFRRQDGAIISPEDAQKLL